MAKINVFSIKEEIVVALRNADIIPIATRGVTTSQDTGTFTADSSYTLATNPTLIKNVRNINVASYDLTFGTDYTVNYETGVITFVNPQTGAYIIDYDQGSTDRIYPDFPQPHLKIANFPRIAVDILSANTYEIELGAGSNYTDYFITTVAYDKSQKNVENLVSEIRTFIMNNKKNFYYFDFITPTDLGPLIPSPFGENKIMQRNQDVRIGWVYEN